MALERPERRAFTCDELRFASEGEGQPARLRGHAAVFNSLSEDFGGWRERIAPGAFADAIVRDDVRALWNHNPDYVLGRNKAGTLRLSEDATGLASEVDPPDTQWARDLMVSIGRGDVTQMSFGFRVVDASWDIADGIKVRTIKRARLFDVSPVTYPAYQATDISVRSLDEIAKEGELALADPETWREELRAMDLRLRMVGL